MTVTELEAMQAALTIKGAIVLLAVLTVCATVLLVLALRRYSRDQDQEHTERMASIQASKDMGQTAWAHSDVHKTQLIREQAKRIRELEQWKADTEARLASIDLRTYATRRR
jgi:membrane protein implicated in regulation of membrane protease activity